ncbi:hypothetical protein T10_3850 [Trichinella papuae]|uniref:Uncharacterized protein n=1 Tax=Trichinella papuae TaxID=268474 RepID=A0A0V1N9M8_9BILA|nr:hypothetical protein T10_3850 [Trichinella papuae]
MVSLCKAFVAEMKSKKVKTFYWSVQQGKAGICLTGLLIFTNPLTILLTVLPVAFLSLNMMFEPDIRNLLIHTLAQNQVCNRVKCFKKL